MKPILIIIALTICMTARAQTKKDTSFNWRIGSMSLNNEIVIYNDTKTVATIDSNGKWTITDSLATIKVLYRLMNEARNVGQYKAELYYALIDVVNASYPKHPTKRAKYYLQKFNELRNKSFNP